MHMGPQDIEVVRIDTSSYSLRVGEEVFNYRSRETNITDLRGIPGSAIDDLLQRETDSRQPQITNATRNIGSAVVGLVSAGSTFLVSAEASIDTRFGLSILLGGIAAGGSAFQFNRANRNRAIRNQHRLSRISILHSILQIKNQPSGR